MAYKIKKAKNWLPLENTTMFQNNTIYRWKHKDNTYKTIEIFKEHDYFVVLGDGFRKVVDTRSEALAYAKEYMKKH